MTLRAALLAAAVGGSRGVVIDGRENCNQVFEAVPHPGQSSDFVTFLGVVGNTSACVDACVAAGNATRRCESYTFHTPAFGAGFAGHCYGRFGAAYGTMWLPVPQQKVNCGRVIYPCDSDAYCQFNGVCDAQSGKCRCSAGWKGYRCEELALLPAVKGSGYNRSGEGISSWGGTVLVDEKGDSDTKYHMYLAEMEGSCGLNSWVSNSVLTHARSTKGFNSPYEKVEVIRGHFAHEPNAMRGNNGEFAMFYAAINTTFPECDCSAGHGSTPPTCQGPGGTPFKEVLAYSEGPSGPWQTCIVFPDRSKHPPLSMTDDTNLAGVVLPNGSFTGLMRHWNPAYGSDVHRVWASNWKDCDSYQIDPQSLFPQLPGAGTEDPFVYRDCNGRFHAIFHNKSPGNTVSLVGGHAYSEDGVTWVYAGTIYGNVVSFTDGTTTSYSRQERPHFIFADDSCTPVALTTGVVYGGKFGDGSFTLLQPVAH